MFPTSGTCSTTIPERAHPLHRAQGCPACPPLPDFAPSALSSGDHPVRGGARPSSEGIPDADQHRPRPGHQGPVARDQRHRGRAARQARRDAAVRRAAGLRAGPRRRCRGVAAGRCRDGAAGARTLRLCLDQPRHAAGRALRHPRICRSRSGQCLRRVDRGRGVGAAGNREFPRHGAFPLCPHRHPRGRAAHRGQGLRRRHFQ